MSARALIAALALVVTAVACEAEEGPCALDYGDCTESSDCHRAACEPLAWAEGSGLICQRSCETELDCPRDHGHAGRCVDVNRSGDYRCYAECRDDATCPDGWVCQPIVSGGARSAICLP